MYWKYYFIGFVLNGFFFIINTVQKSERATSSMTFTSVGAVNVASFVMHHLTRYAIEKYV